MYISLDNTIKNLEHIYRLFFNEWLTADYSHISDVSKELFSDIEDRLGFLICDLTFKRDQFLRDDDGA